jgi:hypothetical protein
VIHLVATIVAAVAWFTPPMNWGLSKRFKRGPLSLNMSKRGISPSGKFGRTSTNTRTRRLRVALPFGGWWHPGHCYGEQEADGHTQEEPRGSVTAPAPAASYPLGEGAYMTGAGKPQH